MKIIRLTAENIKKLKVVNITPDGNVVQLTGPNGSGKSSVLDAIYYALAGTTDIPTGVVRDGEEKAFVKLDLGEVVVTRRFTAKGNTTLTVEAANGARFPSPQTMLDQLIGQLSFDPLAFSRQKPAEQLETLKRVVPLSVDLEELERLNVEDFHERTELNRQVKSLAVWLDGTRFKIQAACQAARIEIIPYEPLDVKELLQQLEEINQANQTLDRQLQELRHKAETFKTERVRQARDLFVEQDLVATTARNLKTEAMQHEKESIRLQAQADEKAELARAMRARSVNLDADVLTLGTKIVQLEEDTEAVVGSFEQEIVAFPKQRPAIDVQEKIRNAQDINRVVAMQREADELTKKLKDQEAAASALTQAIEKRNEAKRRAIETAEMPVEGLGFGAGEVMYQGRPLGNASSAEQLRVSVAIAMAMNPKLRVIRIKDGSLLDQKSLQILAEMALEKDYQVWIERVDTTGRVGIVMEEGTAYATKEG